ncbi:MAG TPA: anti-sigma factor [Baekduia sp.]
MSADEDCRFRDDAGPWVLGALAEPDARAFAAHLEVCPECRREVAELQVVADVLPMAAPQVVPPPEVKRRVMAQVRAEAERAEEPRAVRGAGRGRGERRGRRGWLGRVRPVPAALAATAVLAACVAVVLAVSGGGHTTTYAGTGPDGAQVALRVAGDDHGRLDFQHMPAPPSGRVYQVWLVTGKGPPRPTHALFSVSRDGAASIAIPESLAGTDQVLVSDEPPGGSPTPTGRVVADAKLS